MALIRGTRGWEPRKGLKATRSRTTPRKAAAAIPAIKARKKLTLPGGQEQDRHEGPAHVDLALGEVDESQDAVNHGVAQGDEGVNAAGSQAVK